MIRSRMASLTFWKDILLYLHMSRVIFPVLEPFGHDLDYVYADQATRNKYLYYPLYDTIKAIAQTYANLNRFKISGQIQIFFNR